VLFVVIAIGVPALIRGSPYFFEFGARNLRLVRELCVVCRIRLHGSIRSDVSVESSFLEGAFLVLIKGKHRNESSCFEEFAPLQNTYASGSCVHLIVKMPRARNSDNQKTPVVVVAG